MNLYKRPSDARKRASVQLAAEETTGRLREANGTHRPRRIWLALEGPDIIELKQVVLDRDALGAADFFRRVIVPQVRQAARRHGIPVEEEGDGCLPG